MSDLTKQKCVPCEGKVAPFTPEQTANYLRMVKGWQVVNNHEIVKQFDFRNFKQALKFVNQVGELAEAEGHHPDILIFSYHKVKITLYTQAINGLSQNDFILAAKIDDM